VPDTSSGLWRTWATYSPALGQREHVLPTGKMHIVFRLSGDPVQIGGEEFGYNVVGGTRDGYYEKGVSGPSFSVGAQISPIAARFLLGVPAGELAGSHHRLEDLIGPEVECIRDRLLDAESPEKQRSMLHAFLTARLPRVRGLHPAVLMGLTRFRETHEVGEVVHESGLSHRRFVELFKESVGLTPKLHCRIRRFQRALGVVERHGNSLADLAAESGYSDQSHFSREFVEFAGVTPGQYLKILPGRRNHVPRGQFCSRPMEAFALDS